ncbi:hypothetical protein OROMI_026433 [Orobanche minor]
MVKKRVPDWLNSSLWSSPQLPPEDTVKPAPTPIVDPPLPVPPPKPPTTCVHAKSAAKREIRDPLSSNYGSSSSVCYSDEENGSSAANSTASDGGAVATPPAAEIIAMQAQVLRELVLTGCYPNIKREGLSICVTAGINKLSIYLLTTTDELLPTLLPTPDRLSRKIINMGELRRLASQGIPDGAGIRGTVWKLLLGYLPLDRSLWPSELAKKRSQYKHFKEELLMNPSDITRRLENSSLDNNELDSGQGFLARAEITHGEHPLSLGKSSIWNQFFQETEIMEQIDRDVKRTHPDIPFFSGDSTFSKSNQEALRRVLIVFAKLNPGVRYVQGMNEILAPLFYVVKNDPNEENGLEHTLLLGVNPQFYAFRWITLILTQEFKFADILLIWDTLLSDPDGPQETLLRICCAMLIIVRKRLLAGDFTSNLKLLQNYPSTNISHLLYVASKLRSHLAG